MRASAKGSGIRSRTAGAFLVLAALCLYSLPAPAQALQSGTSIIVAFVIDTAGRPVPGAEVQVVGTSVKGSTDDAGRVALLAVPAGKTVLRLRRLGFAELTVPISVTPGMTPESRYTMMPVATDLKSVVVKANMLKPERYAKTGKYDLLTLTGNPSKEESVEVWETIVKENSKHSGDLQYDSYFTLIQAYYQFVCEYTLVRNMLLKLSTVIDYEFVEACRARGYPINLKDSVSYEKSIAAALRRTANLITRARMKQSEIEREFGGKPQKSYGFEETMANLTMALGFVVPDNVTLARYNEYKKMIKSRNVKTQKDGRV